LNLDITEDLQDQDFSVRHPQSLSTRRVSGALPSPPLACPFGRIYPPAGSMVQLEIQYPVGPHGCGHVYVGPQTVHSISHHFRICVPMPLALSIGSKLGIYAAAAGIPARPDGGLPRPTPFAPQTPLALPRWLHRECPLLAIQTILFTLELGHVTSMLRTLRPRLLSLLDISDGSTCTHVGLRGARK